MLVVKPTYSSDSTLSSVSGTVDVSDSWLVKVASKDSELTLSEEPLDLELESSGGVSERREVLSFLVLPAGRDSKPFDSKNSASSAKMTGSGEGIEVAIVVS
jgi:hypothetical protein